MKNKLALLIIILSFTGLAINVIVNSSGDNLTIWNGLALFRYYTLQSNLLVLIVFTLYLSNTKKELINKAIGGVSIYITITFIVFAIMLSSTYHPTGWNQVSNIISHYIVPIIVLLHLGLNISDYTFVYRDSLYWIIYPSLYIVFIIIYGTSTNDYLYPFFQVDIIGFWGLVITIIILILFFLVLSFLLVKIVSFTKRNKT